MIKPIRRQGRLSDIALVPSPKKSGSLAAASGIPDELAGGDEIMQAVRFFLPGLDHTAQPGNCPQTCGPLHGPMQSPFFGRMRQRGGPMHAPIFRRRRLNRISMNPPGFDNRQQGQDARGEQAYRDPRQYGLEMIIQFLQTMLDACRQMENMPSPGMGCQPPQGQQGFMPGMGCQPPQGQQGFMPGMGCQPPGERE